MTLHRLCYKGSLAEIKEYVETFEEDQLADTLQLRRGIFGYTPLHEAVASGRADVLDYLLKCSGNAEKLVDSTANSDYTPLHVAACSGHKNCARVLLEHGANLYALSVDRKTPIQLGELSAKGGMIRLLHSEGEVLECNLHAV